MKYKVKEFIGKYVRAICSAPTFYSGLTVKRRYVSKRLFPSQWKFPTGQNFTRCFLFRFKAIFSLVNNRIPVQSEYSTDKKTAVALAEALAVDYKSNVF